MTTKFTKTMRALYPAVVSVPLPRWARVGLILAAILCLCLWLAHIWIDTAALRGFADDSGLLFLLHLSKSTFFGHDSAQVYLYSGGFPRDGQFALNALALQAALWLKVTDPQAIKYIFNAWEFVLPGLFYLSLLLWLWRVGKIHWAIFPFAGWLIVGAPIDWNPVNSTRWAVPLFWAYLLLVLMSPRKVTRRAIACTIILGALMLAGLYESVIAVVPLALIAGAVIWRREGNRAPLLLASVGIPGMIYSGWSYFTMGQQAVNNFHGLILQSMVFNDAYFLFIALAVLLVALLLMVPNRFLPVLAILSAGTLLPVAAYMLSGDLPASWAQTELKYDHSVLTLGLMGLAALWRALKFEPIMQARFAAPVILAIGAVLWVVQIKETDDWQSCRAAYDQIRAGNPLTVDTQIAPLMSPRPNLGMIDASLYSRCLWGQYTPWTDILLSPGGKVAHWSLLSFWEDFGFVRKDGTVKFHTNGWTMVSPSLQAGDADLPIKTALYDLTPLLQTTGLGPLFPRAACLDPAQADIYWYGYLANLSDDKRAKMFVCTRKSLQKTH